jgi:hypothetical protein
MWIGGREQIKGFQVRVAKNEHSEVFIFSFRDLKWVGIVKGQLCKESPSPEDLLVGQAIGGRRLE